jgi:hypothetical protein
LTRSKRAALAAGIALLCAWMASAGGRASFTPPAFAAQSVAAASVPTTFALRLLERYHRAIAAFAKPPNMIFTYVESRGGPSRIVTGTHRVYRDAAGDQRNETLEVNGSSLHPPHLQIFSRAVWPYHADQFAVDAAEHDIMFTGVSTINGRRAYVYAVKRLSTAPFEITELALDPSSALPLRERFAVSTPACSGRGEINFAPIASFWLPTIVSAQCDSTDPKAGAQYKDTIRFADYVFPAAIPKDILHPAGAAQ